MNFKANKCGDCCGNSRLVKILTHAYHCDKRISWTLSRNSHWTSRQKFWGLIEKHDMGCSEIVTYSCVPTFHTLKPKVLPFFYVLMPRVLDKHSQCNVHHCCDQHVVWTQRCAGVVASCCKLFDVVSTGDSSQQQPKRHSYAPDMFVGSNKVGRWWPVILRMFATDP